jgi:hypothetical protein
MAVPITLWTVFTVLILGYGAANAEALDNSVTSRQLVEFSGHRTLMLALEVDRDGARLIAFTLKEREFVPPRETPSPKTYAAGDLAHVEVALVGPAGARYTQRVAVPGLCLAHGPDAPPEIDGDTIHLHRESFVVEAPEAAGFDQLEVGYYPGQANARSRTLLGTATLDAAHFTSAGGRVRYEDLVIARPLPTSAPRSPLTPGSIHFPEEFGDPDIFTVYGSEAETSKRINIVIVPDGYTYVQKATMQVHARSMVNALRARTPYSEHDRFINYILVYAYSTEAGTDECDCSFVRDTAMSTRFTTSTPTCGHNDNRCLYYGGGCDTDTSAHIATTELRAPANDTTIVMVNTTRYGGCAGARAVYAAANGYATEIAVHELGHSLAGLDDEYGGEPSCGVGSGINTSMDSINGNWPEWVADLGAPWEGAKYYDACIYRPDLTCAMRELWAEFCPVCTQQWALTYFGHPRVSPTAPIETMNPGPLVNTTVGVPTAFSIGTRLASGPGVSNDVTWQLQGPGFPTATTVATSASHYSRSFSPPGTYTVTSQVVADTNFIKPSKNGANVGSASWTVSVCDPTGESSASNNGPLCSGATLQLTAATFTDAAYSWTGPSGFHSSAQNPAIPNAALSASGTYTVTIAAPGCSYAATTIATVIGDESACDDGDACTRLDTCLGGACIGSDPVVCTALDQCREVGSCNANTGACSNPAKPDGTTCDDANACTLIESCYAGICSWEAARDCDDANACTANTCERVVGCMTRSVNMDTEEFSANRIDGRDLVVLATAWHSCPGNERYVAAADIDNVACVDSEDFHMFMAAFGHSCP